MTTKTKQKKGEIIDNMIAIETKIEQNNALTAQRFGYENIEYNKETILIELDSRRNLAAKTVFEMGYLLLLLKENEPHGSFGDILKERGISKFSASRIMKATIKLGDIKSSKIELLNSSKLFEIMLLDDEDIEVLVGGGSINDVVLDDIDRMTVRELKDTIKTIRRRNVDLSEEKQKAILETEKKADELARFETIGVGDSNELFRSFSFETNKMISALTEVYLSMSNLTETLNNNEHLQGELRERCIKDLINKKEMMAEEFYERNTQLNNACGYKPVDNTDEFGFDKDAVVFGSEKHKAILNQDHGEVKLALDDDEYADVADVDTDGDDKFDEDEIKKLLLHDITAVDDSDVTDANAGKKVKVELHKHAGFLELDDVLLLRNAKLETAPFRVKEVNKFSYTLESVKQ